VGVAGRRPHGYLGVVDTGFQPAGRAPAPPPLDLVQDFVNTEIPEWQQDDIADPASLADWLRRRGLLAADEDVASEAFVRARTLRTGLRELARRNTMGGAPGTALVERLGDVLRPLSLAIRLDAEGRLVVAPRGSGTDRALAALVAVVLEAQRDGTWSRVKACRKESCGWVFYDASRNRSSSWCAMTICGNRVKTAAYRRRRGGGA
jgi:predicted RNA-binding Zn ribbon-like protein